MIHCVLPAVETLQGERILRASRALAIRAISGSAIRERNFFAHLLSSSSRYDGGLYR